VQKGGDGDDALLIYRHIGEMGKRKGSGGGALAIDGRRALRE
jgi:hypothetical protein